MDEQRIVERLDRINELLDLMIKSSYDVDWVWGYTVGSSEKDDSNKYVLLWAYNDGLVGKIAKVYERGNWVAPGAEVIAPYWNIDWNNVKSVANQTPAGGRQGGERPAYIQAGWITPTPTRLQVITKLVPYKDSSGEEKEAKRVFGVLDSDGYVPGWARAANLNGGNQANKKPTKKKSDSSDFDWDLILSEMRYIGPDGQVLAEYMRGPDDVRKFAAQLELPDSTKGPERRDAVAKAGLTYTITKYNMMLAGTKQAEAEAAAMSNAKLIARS